MFEVKYPNSYGLDGKIHKIKIIQAVEVDSKSSDRILIRGVEAGKDVLLEVAYIPSEKKWVKVSHTALEYARLITKFFWKKM